MFGANFYPYLDFNSNVQNAQCENYAAAITAWEDEFLQHNHIVRKSLNEPHRRADTAGSHFELLRYLLQKLPHMRPLQPDGLSLSAQVVLCRHLSGEILYDEDSGKTLLSTVAQFGERKASQVVFIYLHRSTPHPSALLNEVDINGKSALHYLCQFSWTETLKHLVALNSEDKFSLDLDRVDANGGTPLGYCQSWRVIKVLLGCLSSHHLLIRPELKAHKWEDRDEGYPIYPNIFELSLYFEHNGTQMILLYDKASSDEQTALYESFRRELRTSRVKEYLKAFKDVEMYDIANATLRELLFLASAREAKSSLIEKFLTCTKDPHEILIRRDKDAMGKTALEWSVENGDRVSTTLILREEYKHHPDMEEGLRCIKDQVKSDELLSWTVTTFKLYYGRTLVEKLFRPCINAVLTIISLLKFLYDYASDIELCRSFLEKSRHPPNMTHSGKCNATHMDQCDDVITPENYFTAFWLTCLCITIPILIFTIIWYLEYVKPFFGKLYISVQIQYGPWKAFFIGVILIVAQIIALCLSFLLPLFIMGEMVSVKFQHRITKRKSRFRSNLWRLEYLWGMLNSIESGVEASGQLLIQLWLLTYFNESLSKLTLKQMIGCTVSGILFFIPLNQNEMSISLGKLLISAVGVGSGVINSYRMTKRGSISSSNSVFLKVSITLQVLLRLLVFGYFFTEMKASTYELTIIMGVLLAQHYINVGLIKYFMENTKQIKGMYPQTSTFVNTIASSLVYIRIVPPAVKSSHQEGKLKSVKPFGTFKAQTLFFSLVFVENLALILLPLFFDGGKIHLYWGEHARLIVILCTIFASMIIWILHCCFYKVFGHPWTTINGPQYITKPMEDQANRLIEEVRLDIAKLGQRSDTKQSSDIPIILT